MNETMFIPLCSRRRRCGGQSGHYSRGGGVELPPFYYRTSWRQLSGGRLNGLNLVAVAEPVANRWRGRVLEEHDECSPELDGAIRGRRLRAGPCPERRRPGSPFYGGQGTEPRRVVHRALPAQMVEISPAVARGAETCHGWWRVTPVETVQQERGKECSCLNSPKQDRLSPCEYLRRKQWYREWITHCCEVGGATLFGNVLICYRIC